jgi:hypothetical protein
VVIKILSPLEFPNWNEQVADLPGATIFHSSNWARVLSDSYGYKPRYFTALGAGRISGCIPMMQVDSFITGRRGVGLPFSDFCQPLGDDESVQELWHRVVNHANVNNWKHVEIRGDNAVCQSVPSSSIFMVHTIDLNTTESGVWANIKESARRNVKKAAKNNVYIHRSQSMKAIKTFYRLNCITRQRHRLPPQPYQFFKNIQRYLLSTGNGFILLAIWNKIAIAAAVFFQFNGLLVYKFAASDMAYQHLRANNQLIWHAIKIGIKERFIGFHFGRTDSENHGLLQFKRGWGSDEQNIHYFKYNLKERQFIKKKSESKASYALFKKMPMPLLKFSGQILYRHVG